MNDDRLFHGLSADLETMGTGPDAAIVAIGAVEFWLSRDGSQTLGREFYRTVDLASSMRSGGTVDASTIIWWAQQSETARAEFAKATGDLWGALVDFADFYQDISGNVPKVRVWGNGADFDNVILAGAYRRYGEDVPWQPTGKPPLNGCLRTLRALFPDAPKTTPEIPHHALHDAQAQALDIMTLIGRATG